jgi:hypothetical protein
MRVKIISVLMLLCLALQILTNAAFAQYLDEQFETNINKVDPLFKRSVPNLEEFKKGIEQDKKVLAEQIGKNMMPPIADSGKIANERAKLESLDALELDSIARREMAKDPFHNEMFVDLSRPGMQAHLEDAKKIAKGSSKMIGSIIANLKDIGVDCKTVKGNIERDPEYFMELKKEVDSKEKDTIYDQHFCERLRNKYSCSSTLSMKCTSEGKQWGEWQDRTIGLPCDEVLNRYPVHQGSFFISKNKESKTVTEEDTIKPGIRVMIAHALRVELQQISQNVSFVWVTGLPYAAADGQYTFKYKYRDWKKICTAWSEVWHEHCRLKN